MHLALIVAAVLAAESVEAPPPPEPPNQGEGLSLSRNKRRLIGLGIGSVALGTGAALGAWLDRDGTFGRICAITAGTLGTALLTASLAALISSWIFPEAPQGDTVEGVAAEIIVDTGRAIAIGVAAFIAGLVGLAAGAIMSGFVSEPAGTQRGVLGVAGGGALIATSITLMVVVW